MNEYDTMGSQDDPVENCDKCGKPVQPGEARYAGLREGVRHAACHDWRSSKEIMDELQARLEETRASFEALRRRR